MRLFPPSRRRINPAQAGAGADIHPTSGSGTVAPDSMSPPSQREIEEQRNAPVPVYLSGHYGNVQYLAFTFAVAGNQLVLARPVKAQRVLLVIANDLAAGTMRVNFDAPAAAAIGIPIVAGGNLFLDVAVPQNDIYIFSPGGGVASVMYLNVDITNPTNVLQANA